MKIYQNIENGNIHETRAEAEQEAAEMYDYGDDTNPVSFWEYYRIIDG